MVEQPFDKTTLKDGEAVKVRRGKSKRFWNGVIAFLKEEECPSTSEDRKVTVERERKRKLQPGIHKPKSKRVGKHWLYHTIWSTLA